MAVGKQQARRDTALVSWENVSIQNNGNKGPCLYAYMLLESGRLGETLHFCRETWKM